MLIFRMWLGLWICLFCTSRRLISWIWTVQYQCQYFTIDISISECDHKCETRNAEPEIGTHRSRKTWRIPRVDQQGTGFDLPRVSGSGVWPRLELNQPGFAVQTRSAVGLPGPIPNTTPCVEFVRNGQRRIFVYRNRGNEIARWETTHCGPRREAVGYCVSWTCKGERCDTKTPSKASSKLHVRLHSLPKWDLT
jgi:hypothetical protein